MFMVKKVLISLITVPLMLLVFTTSYAGLGFRLPNIELFYNGNAQPNTFNGKLPQVFNTYCAGVCVPTTQIEVTDPPTGIPVGMIYVWAKNFTSNSAGTTLCFTEFIKFDLPLGSIYVQANPNGTCGAYLDPTLAIPPISLPDLSEIAGGGRGNIVYTTGIYSGWQNGTYLDRVVVYESGTTIAYYDGLYFTLMPPSQHK
jgi:hypothetical protein